MTLENDQPRKRLTLADQVTILKRQAICPLCGGLLGDGPVTDEHMVARGIGGSEALENRQFCHKVCSAIKTSGPKTKAFAQGDITEIAKAKRVAKKEAAFVAKLFAKGIDTPEPQKSASGRRKWPSGRKIEGRGFRTRQPSH